MGMVKGSSGRSPITNRYRQQRRTARRRTPYIRTPSPNPVRRGNTYVSRTSAPASGWMSTGVRSTPSRSSGPSSGNSGPSSGSSGSRPTTAPRPYSPPSPPSPPKPKRLSYNQLLAMVGNDPAMKALLAAYSRGEKLAKSQAAQSKGLFETEYKGDLAALERGRDKTAEEAMEEAAAAGRLRSGVYGDRQQDILSSFEEGKGRLGRVRNRGRVGVEQAQQQALEQFRLQRAQARQAAIDRLLAQRSDIQRGY